MSRNGGVATVALAAVCVIGTAQAAAPGDRRVDFPYRIGAYHIGGTYRDAVAAFGRPSDYRRRYGGICEVAWHVAGLRLFFRNVDASPCTHRGLEAGRFIEAKILSRTWSVDRGVRVGDSWARVKRIYSIRYPPGTSLKKVLGRGEIGLGQRLVRLPGTTAQRYLDLGAFFQHHREGAPWRLAWFDLAYD